MRPYPSEELAQPGSPGLLVVLAVDCERALDEEIAIRGEERDENRGEENVQVVSCWTSTIAAGTVRTMKTDAEMSNERQKNLT